MSHYFELQKSCTLHLTFITYNVSDIIFTSQRVDLTHTEKFILHPQRQTSCSMTAWHKLCGFQQHPLGKNLQQNM
jgi:hypothetical protein